MAPSERCEWVKGKAGQWLVYEIDQAQEPRREIVSEPSIRQLKVTKRGGGLIKRTVSLFLMNTIFGHPSLQRIK